MKTKHANNFKTLYQLSRKGRSPSSQHSNNSDSLQRMSKINQLMVKTHCKPIGRQKGGTHGHVRAQSCPYIQNQTPLLTQSCQSILDCLQKSEKTEHDQIRHQKRRKPLKKKNITQNFNRRNKVSNQSTNPSGNIVPPEHHRRTNNQPQTQIIIETQINSPILLLNNNSMSDIKYNRYHLSEPNQWGLSLVNGPFYQNQPHIKQKFGLSKASALHNKLQAQKTQLIRYKIEHQIRIYEIQQSLNKEETLEKKIVAKQNVLDELAKDYLGHCYFGEGIQQEVDESEVCRVIDGDSFIVE